MTSTSSVRNEIRRFLKGTAPEVLCVTGKWGVGKTYLWKTEVAAAQNANGIDFKRYAYVSLFGLESLDALKTAIVEETVDVGSIGKMPDLEAINAPQKWKSTVGGWVARAAKAIPGIRDYVIDASQLLFSLLVRKQIVCIDDLERSGRDLLAKDVLGLVSFLKEERGCRVVILLNQEELDKEDKIDFNLQLEKVIDTRLEFHPTPAEAAQIAIAGNSDAEKYLSENCKSLSITNIRVIRKIGRLVKRLEEILSGHHPGILRQAVHSATLFGWIVYQPKEGPPLEFLTEQDSWAYALREEEDAPEREKAWRAALTAYQFHRIDEFDEVILNGVKAGFFDESKLKESAQPIELQLNVNQQHGAFREAWQLYHNSFTATAEEVLTAIEVAFRAGIQAISPADLSGTVTLFKQLGREQRARELLEFYMESNKDSGRELFDLKKHPFGSQISDPDVREAFAAKSAAVTVRHDPKATLKKIAESSGWNPEDLQLLASLSVEEYVSLFKESGGSSLNIMVQRTLEFARYEGGTSEMKKISTTATEALRLIGSESLINALRVSRYGITPIKTGEKLDNGKSQFEELGSE